MAGNDVFLYPVPSDADADDVRLRDPTQIAAGGTTDAVATASGLGAAQAVGSSVKAATASASGAGAANATGVSIKAAVANASGTGLAAATGVALVGATASAAGVGTASGVGRAVVAATANATGLGTASGSGSSLASATASATGVGTATGVGQAIEAGGSVGTASGIGTALGVGASIVEAVGTAAGIGNATGVSATAEVVEEPAHGGRIRAIDFDRLYVPFRIRPAENPAEVVVSAGKPQKLRPLEGAPADSAQTTQIDGRASSAWLSQLIGELHRSAELIELQAARAAIEHAAEQLRLEQAAIAEQFARDEEDAIIAILLAA